MLTPIIYKRDASQKIRTWQAEAVAGRWRSHAGIMHGNLVTSEWSDAPAKSQGTPEAQAEFEALAQHKKLLAKDYRPSLELVDELRGSWIKPMLAQDFKRQVGPCFVQPKLDGMRCLANADGLWSRGAKPIIIAPHIEQTLDRFFRMFPQVVLDGELYNHSMHDDFNGLMSILKKGTGKGSPPSTEDFKRSRDFIQYFLYDCYDVNNPDWRFSGRIEFIHSHFSQHEFIEIVPTVLTGNDAVDKLHIDFCTLGYEGSIIRLDWPYEQKRSKALLKNKSWVTEELRLISINEGEGNWAGYAKTATVMTKDGVLVNPGIRGNQDYCRDLLNAPVGSFESATVRHFGFTLDGSLRFPTVISFNERGGLENRPVLDSTSTEEEM